MKPIKTLVLVALAVLATMAFASPSVMAESTALCSVDPIGGTQCPSGYLISHVHEVSVFKGKLLAGAITVECDVLFLGDVGALGSPQVIEGNFTYTNCGKCSVTEENGPAEIEVLKEGHEYGGSPQNS
jgi:hypothetical protein